MLRIGDKVTNPAEITNAIGEWFRAGTVFTVIQEGTVNARAQAPNGSLVWIVQHTDGSYRFFSGCGGW